MAASDPHPRPDGLSPSGSGLDCVSPSALRERLEEEISRAERHASRLSCLLVVVENLDKLTREHGSELREQTIEYVGRALRRELRRYDRVGPGRPGAAGELLIILPHTDSPRGEIVARRALSRLRSIKVEAGGTRLPLHVSVGLAEWRSDVSAEELLTQVGSALRNVNGEGGHPALDRGAMQARQPTQDAELSTSAAIPPALGRAGSP